MLNEKPFVKLAMLSWGSLFVLVWLLVLGIIPVDWLRISVLIFFLLVAILSTSFAYSPPVGKDAEMIRGVRRKTDNELVNSFGLNFDQVKILLEANPKQAAGDLLHAYGKFFIAGDSQTELRWRAFASPILENVFGSRPVWSGHNSVSWKLPGAMYTPDYMYILESERVVYVEIKASKMQPGYRDARSKIRAAATLYPFFHWYEAMPNKEAVNGWLFEEIKGDPEFRQTLLDLRAAYTQVEDLNPDELRKFLNEVKNG